MSGAFRLDNWEATESPLFNVSVVNRSNCTSTGPFWPSETRQYYMQLVMTLPSSGLIIICSFVCYVLLRDPEFRAYSNLLLINSAAADLFRGLLSFFCLWAHFKLPEYNTVTIALCRIYLFLKVLQNIWSRWAMVFLVYDRYGTLRNPCRLGLKQRTVRCVIPGIILLSAFISSLPLFVLGDYTPAIVPNSSLAFCALVQPKEAYRDRFFLPLCDIVSYVLPMVVVTVFYAKVVLLASRYRSTGFQQSTSTCMELDKGERPRTTRRRDDREVIRNVLSSRALKLVAFAVLVNIVFSVPLVAFLEVINFAPEDCFFSFFFRLPVLLLYVCCRVLSEFNFVGNCLLYLFLLKHTIKTKEINRQRRRRIRLASVIRACN